MRQDNIFLNQLMAKLPTEIESWEPKRQLEYHCELYKEFYNKRLRWNGDDFDEFRDLEYTVDVLAEIIMHIVMEMHGYKKFGNEDDWQWQKHR